MEDFLLLFFFYLKVIISDVKTSSLIYLLALWSFEKYGGFSVIMYHNISAIAKLIIIVKTHEQYSIWYAKHAQCLQCRCTVSDVHIFTQTSSMLCFYLINPILWMFSISKLRNGIFITIFKSHSYENRLSFQKILVTMGSMLFIKCDFFLMRKEFLSLPNSLFNNVP